MNVYVDESGSFAFSKQSNGWNVVAAIAAAESARSVLRDALQTLRITSGGLPLHEVKLNRVNESSYLAFLHRLDRKDVLLFATATDAGLNTEERVAQHQSIQVSKIRDTISRMRYESGRAGLRALADDINGLSPQLYVQLVCQAQLIDDVIRCAINYYAQRRPQALRSFRWRIDQKNADKPTFEHTFERIVPPLLQSKSIRHPFEAVREFNYSHMTKFRFEGDKAPDYLQTEYGLPAMEGFDLGKILRTDMSFVDSRSSDGVQVADLLASGLRSLLRGKFGDNRSIASALGNLMLQNRRGHYPISLVTLSDVEGKASGYVSSIVRQFASNSKAMLAAENSTGK